jgi:hypothetical protein
MQDVISQLAENPAYKILFWRRKKEIEILDALSNSKDNVINVAGKMKLQQELSAIWMSWFPWILGMLILLLCWGKSYHTLGCYASLCRFSPFHQPLETLWFQTGTISHATHLRLWK